MSHETGMTADGLRNLDSTSFADAGETAFACMVGKLDSPPPRTYFAPAFSGGLAGVSASEPPREPRGTPSGEPGDLARLGERIDRLRGATAETESERTAAQQGKALSAGWRISIELVVAVAFCGVVGYLIDVWLGIRPWAMIGGVVLGFIVGVRMAMKTANEMEADYLRREAEKRGGTTDGKR